MKVALIGRTNVGKSSLFNRLIGQRRAIVSPVPGTTRDRNFGECSWRGLTFELIDTGGLDIKQATEIEKNVVMQAELASKIADLVLVVVDAQTGLLPQDKEVIKKLRQNRKSFMLVANKADSPRLRDQATEEFSSIGEKVFPVSAANGTGTGDLLDDVLVWLTKSKNFKKEAETNKDTLTKVAIIGRPNVGKSSLLNGILGRDFVIVSDIPHTTREPQDTLITHKDNLILLIDTAGIRKHAKIMPGIEKMAAGLSIDTLYSADVALLVLEANEPISSQDKYLASEIVKCGVSLIIIFNKWDMLKGDERDPKKFHEDVLYELPFVRWAPILFTSAKNKKNVDDIMDEVIALKKERSKFIDEDTLDKMLKGMVKHHKPVAAIGPAAPRLLGLKQLGTNPPYFELVADRRQIVAQAYVRYVENSLRKKFAFRGTPIKIRVRGIKS